MKTPVKPSSIFLFFTNLIIVSTAISPSFALGANNQNLLQIGVMAICPLILLVIDRVFYQADFWLIFFMISIVIFPLTVNPESMRWSTVLYTLMYGFTFLTYSQLLHKGYFTIERYHNLLKYLIYAFALVLLMQQFCVLTGLPIINLSNHNPAEPWKLNSLTSEPSHSARILALLMYCYIITIELRTKRLYNFRLALKKDKWVWLSFLWTMVTMGSGAAFVFISVFLIKFARLKTLLGLLVILGLIAWLVGIMGVTAHERGIRLFIAVWTFDVNAIVEADPSGAYRVVPLVLLAQMVDVTTIEGWFGHGIDYVGSSLSFWVPYYMPEGWTGGGLLQLWMDYGFLSFMLFMIFSFLSFFRRGDYASLVFWFMLVFVNGINGQILWLCLVLLFTNKYFGRRVISNWSSHYSITRK